MPLRFQNRFVGAGEYKLQARVPVTSLNKIAALIMREIRKIVVRPKSKVVFEPIEWKGFERKNYATATEEKP